MNRGVRKLDGEERKKHFLDLLETRCLIKKVVCISIYLSMDKEGERDYKEYMFGGLVKEVCNPEGRRSGRQDHEQRETPMGTG